MSEKNDISSALASVTKKWKAEKRKANKDDRLSHSQFQVFSRPYRTTIRDSAFEHMEEAYNKASANGKYYANARQIYYAARPLILEDTSKYKLESNYFTQTLLKDYLEEYAPDWKVVWDARGHFEEPHTGRRIGVGGIEVEKYMNSWVSHIPKVIDNPIDELINTKGSSNRFKSVLFIEKEGFNEILRDANISKKYDLAIISTKGIPVKAACDLLSTLQKDVQIFTLHDFDKSGFTILKTLEEGTRMSSGIDFIDLGFRLEDIEGLPTEGVCESSSYRKAKYHLEECGATEEEVNFLIKPSGYRGWQGERVELNAMMSDEFIKWLEGKLKKHGVKKVIPSEEDLSRAYQRACLGHEIEGIIKEKKETYYHLPHDLEKRVEKYLKENPEEPWDNAVWNIAGKEENNESEEIERTKPGEVVDKHIKAEEEIAKEPINKRGVKKVGDFEGDILGTFEDFFKIRG